MKSLAFFCIFLLAQLAAHAQVATNSTGTFSGGPASGPDWSAAIEKLGKENEAAAENAIAISPAETLTDAAKSAAPAAAKAASAPSTRASGAAGAAASDAKDEDWAGSVRNSIKDVIKPFQEFLPEPEATKEIDPLAEERRRSRAAYGAPGQAAPALTEAQRKAQQHWTSVMIEELVDELVPWAIGAMVLLALGFGVSLWVSYVKRKPSVPIVKSSRPQARSGKKRRRLI